MFLGERPQMDPRPLDGMTVSEWLGRALRSPSARTLVEVIDPDGHLRQRSRPARAPEPACVSFEGARPACCTCTAAGRRSWTTCGRGPRRSASGSCSGARVAEIELDRGTAAEGTARRCGRSGWRTAVATRSASAILAVPPTVGERAGGRRSAGQRWPAGPSGPCPSDAASLDIGLRRLPSPGTGRARARSAAVPVGPLELGAAGPRGRRADPRPAVPWLRRAGRRGGRARARRAARPGAAGLARRGGGAALHAGAWWWPGRCRACLGAA